MDPEIGVIGSRGGCGPAGSGSERSQVEVGPVLRRILAIFAYPDHTAGST